MASIAKSALLTLLSHADPSTPPALRAWSRPPTFGESNAYPTLARLAAAGLTPEALDGLGLAIQGEILPRLRETQETGGQPAKLSDGEGRRARYYANGHKRAVHYAVSMESSPSGLRPSSIPNSAKAPHITAWHHALVAAANAATGDTVEIPPLVTGDGTALGSPRAANAAPRASGPFGRFMGLRTLFASVCADINTALESCDDPESVSQARGIFLSHAMPAGESLAGITADSFDATTIRVGSPVVFVDGTPALRVAGIIAKSSGIELPAYYHVASMADGVVTLDVGAVTRKPITAKIADVRRYVAPKPAPVVDASAWKPSVDGLAVYEGEEVLVCALSEDGVASILGSEGETDVAVEFLSAPSA